MNSLPRVTPIALSKLGIPDSAVLMLSEYPLQGLRLYDDLETCEQYSGYVWSNWTTKTVQPAHIDNALQAVIDQSSEQPLSNVLMLLVNHLTPVLNLHRARRQGSRGAMRQHSQQHPLILTRQEM